LLPLIALILIGLATTGVVYLIFRSLSKQASTSIGKERDIIRDEITKYDEALEVAISTLGTMVSLNEQANIEVEREKLKASIELEGAKVKKLEKELESLQQRVDKQELTHNELKKGKEDSDKLAAVLRENKDRLQAEANELSQVLSSATALINSSAAKFEGREQQELATLENAMRITANGLKESAEVYARGALRFVNLEKQYEELEREFRKLVDKALTGEEVEAED